MVENWAKFVDDFGNSPWCFTEINESGLYDKFREVEEIYESLKKSQHTPFKGLYNPLKNGENPTPNLLDEDILKNIDTNSILEDNIFKQFL